MAELADALDSGSNGRKAVQVQVLLPAPSLDDLNEITQTFSFYAQKFVSQIQMVMEKQILTEHFPDCASAQKIEIFILTGMCSVSGIIPVFIWMHSVFKIEKSFPPLYRHKGSDDRIHCEFSHQKRYCVNSHMEVHTISKMEYKILETRVSGWY